MGFQIMKIIFGNCFLLIGHKSLDSAFDLGQEDLIGKLVIDLPNIFRKTRNILGIYLGKITITFTSKDKSSLLDLILESFSCKIS
jgi:hypothetical protein